MAYHPCEQKVKILLNTFFEKCEEMGWKWAIRRVVVVYTELSASSLVSLQR